MKGIGKEDYGLYVLTSRSIIQAMEDAPTTRNLSSVPKSLTVNTTEYTRINVALWHRRLGHIPLDILKKVSEFQSVKFDDTEHHCTVCLVAKQTRLPFPLSTSTAHSNFDIIHVDVWGPYRLPTCDGKRYFFNYS